MHRLHGPLRGRARILTLVADAIAAFSQAEIDATVGLNAPAYATVVTTAVLVRDLAELGVAP